MEDGAGAPDFGYDGDEGANRERITNKTLAVRYVARSELFPFLGNARALADVLVPTPQEMRLFREVLGEQCDAARLRVARIYRRLRYVPRGDATRVERADA
ncbi:MC071R [Molluscum contagiosum virus subtype 1]|uniref:MC071R n=3 Tax=Molluscum contagiosum virus TaxID=10279 RepID=Q98239_MCV1|nr:MC071R [Molluscum contagiosum virus subtype 1]AZT86333.1 MC071R [Molluscum contagiosum virus]AAC55199.1 MC071R [Molluscum contagiosum virus subtype 1]AQY16820.1 MC071 [Molluscum contagiosum virus subtype 1]AQY16999.1 MC071 [Molluscum contagiosum virus subtype 1]AQY17178.1 MC071 [Molluscum contagiosum virus subtype 1]